ncbi:MAG: 2-amino-4-ketopentanoate thiolase [Dehalococcoidia bacterium]|nr:MAG: 2-amino-4-ketopentanoate thiolase [Dehalococcoidia bacterium]
MVKEPQNVLKGTLVQIHKVILTPEQRPEDIPACTKNVPYEAWIKGFLLDDEARIGDTVQIETFIGRRLSGTLVEVNPVYIHNFGKPQPALLPVGKRIGKRRQ